VHEDSYVARRGSISAGIDDVVDVDAGGRGEEGVSEAGERFAVEAPVLLLRYDTSARAIKPVQRNHLPLSSSRFSSSVSSGWKTPLFHATVAHVFARLNRPKLSLKTNQARLVSLLLDFCAVADGGAGMFDSSYARGWLRRGRRVSVQAELESLAVWGHRDAGFATSNQQPALTGTAATLRGDVHCGVRARKW
jgi:hypothetical protein